MTKFPTLLLAIVVGVALGSACGRSELEPPAGTGGSTPIERPPTLLPPSPGIFLCGTEICATASQQCCLGVATSGGLGASCQRLGSACVGAALQCDEPADCRSAKSGAAGGGPVCCFGLDATTAPANPQGLGIGSRCEAASSCVGLGRFVLCSADSDCGPKGGVCCASAGLPICQARCPGL